MPRNNGRRTHRRRPQPHFPVKPSATRARRCRNGRPGSSPATRGPPPSPAGAKRGRSASADLAAVLATCNWPRLWRPRRRVQEGRPRLRPPRRRNRGAPIHGVPPQPPCTDRPCGRGSTPPPGEPSQAAAWRRAVHHDARAVEALREAKRLRGAWNEAAIRTWCSQRSAARRSTPRPSRSWSPTSASRRASCLPVVTPRD